LHIRQLKRHYREVMDSRRQIKPPRPGREIYLPWARPEIARKADNKGRSKS
jgi:hypothetical protein